MSQRVIVSLIAVNGHRELLGVEDVKISVRALKVLEKLGQQHTTRFMRELLILCENELNTPEVPRHD